MTEHAGILKIDSQQVVYAIYMLNDRTDECTFVSAHPSMDAAKTAREDLPGYDGETGPIILPVRLVAVPVNEAPPSEWITSRSLEANPQQLVGRLAGLLGKGGGYWEATVADYHPGDRTYILTNGDFYGRGSLASFKTETIWLYDIARARIIKEQ
jgi:hypothetical protein